MISPGENPTEPLEKHLSTRTDVGVILSAFVSNSYAVMRIFYPFPLIGVAKEYRSSQGVPLALFPPLDFAFELPLTAAKLETGLGHQGRGVALYCIPHDVYRVIVPRNHSQFKNYCPMCWLKRRNFIF